METSASVTDIPRQDMSLVPSEGSFEGQSDREHFLQCNELYSRWSCFFPRHMQKIPRVGSSLYFDGCCFLADISGFTKLSNQLCAKGPKGIDKLRIFTNKSLALFVNLVYEYGGDVMEFAGDSLLCVFKTETENGMSSCILKAIKCGLSIAQSQIDGISTHVGITYGRMCFAMLGGHNGRFTYLLNGHCIDEVGKCLDLASAHEVVVTRAVFTAVESSVSGSPLSVKDGTIDTTYFTITGEKKSVVIRGRSWTSKCFVPSTAADSYDDDLDSNNPRIREIMFRCVPLPVTRALVSNTFSELSEIRTVTTLFLKLNNYRTIDFFDLSDMQPFFLAMQRCLDECGGFLRQFLIDDKGCVLIGLWGVPTASHAANCSKALRCAVMMKNEASNLLYSVSIGITTGSVYCGTVGTSNRRDYVAIGSTVNLSARLMVASHERILMDPSTYERLPLSVSGRCVLTEPLRMKGVAVDIPYYCYSSSTPPDAFIKDVRGDSMVVIESYTKRILYNVLEDSCFTPPSSGRQKTQQLSPTTSTRYISQSNDARSSTSSPSSTVLVISGVSGQGKTATIHYFIRRYTKHSQDNNSAIHRHHPGVLYVELSVHDEGRYGAVRKLIDAAVSWHGVWTPKSQADFLKETLISAYPDLSLACIASKLYPTVKQALGINDDWTVPGDASSWCSDVEACDIQILSRLCSRLIGHNLRVLCIDNIHFMCPVSWKVLSALCISGHPRLVVLTVRVKSIAGDDHSIPLNYDDSEDQDLANILSMAKVRSAFAQDDSITPTRRITEYAEFRREIGECRRLDLNLKPLSLDTVRKIIASEIPGDIPPSSANTVFNFCRGNPLVLWRLIAYYNMSDCCDINELLYRIKQNSLVALTVEKFTQSHVAILKYASVIGEHFSVSQLKRILPNDLHGSVKYALQLFEDNGTLYPLCDEFYSFTSYLIRSMYYNLLPRSDAVAIHARVVDCLSDMLAPDCPSFDFSFCYHCSMSNLKAHRKRGLLHSSAVIERCIAQKKVESTFPFFEFSIKCIVSNGDRRKVLKLLESCISTAQEEILNQNEGPLLEQTATKLGELVKKLKSRLDAGYFILNGLMYLFRGRNRRIHVTDSSHVV
mmetsp:Transcript_23624/g.34643  ORF Transcript_23624/g.34643 Transcript_23624/m.34643 type:complete len:1106 (-) Transcript_23624:396-3713(-)|eukprot:CAMPEP_0185035632 /NCGR_PEP_ID=MMETSP1103-20130426/27349_1 /TAXON_ID=36769 /ORGANISM="Paraphysomonas bandaiensis, Strain Caron Lab Isolate" /LENGTH=1105 /DNA_ID=CAMNT_0027572807 /DNA_START=90 /DNA_END=3407 /DNA_ORIENTATION=-